LETAVAGGPLAYLLGPLFARFMLTSYRAFNEALKQRVEGAS
jgi:hypothetical protein